jgi:tetratricopeptide (TPR) repeat protein/TolB-like protein
LRVEHGGLADLAASVADGTPVDWSAVELRGNAADRRLAGHLRLVESIASLHRSIPAHEHEQVVEPEPEKTVGPGPSDAHWGRLSLLERIGEGTSCEVYRAWDTALHRDVALKLLHDEGGHREAHARTLEEARRLARVRHAHVVQVYGAEQHDDRVGLWMELVRGESLEQIVKARGPFGAREAALIGLDLCAALAAVHQAQLLHRDVKAQNVMRESGGRIVLMDFGTGEELSGTNRLVGTPLYLAPEIFSGSKASVQSDLYSLGVLLFHLVTGTYPVMAASMEQLGRAHANRERHPLRDLRPDLFEPFVAAVERAIDSDPSRRYQSAGDMETALRESLDSLPRPVGAPTTAAAPRARRLGLAFMAAAAAVVLTIAGLIVWSRTAQINRGAVASAIRTIAVLPMSQVPGSRVPPHFADGLTDELMSTLGQLHALSVKSGLSVRGLDERPRKEIARELDVDALLETTLSGGAGESGSPGRLAVRADLVAAGTGAIVWTRKFERPQGETQALQSDIAVAITEAVRAAVSPLESARLQQTRKTVPAAEEAYLLGRVHMDGYGAGSGDQALKAFARALQVDPLHAGAHAGAARAHIILGLNGAVSQAQARAQALTAAQRALELDPNLAEAHATLGHISFVYDWNWPAAERSFRQSLELNPSSPYARTFYAEHLAALGRFDEAVAQAQTAKRLDPESGAAARRYGLILYYKHDFAAAERARVEAMAIEPNSAAGPLLEGRIQEALGRFSEALDSTRRAADLSGAGGVPLRVQIIRLEALSGLREEAADHFRELQREASSRAIRLSPRDLAYVYLALGDANRAVTLFSQAVDERDPTVVWLGVDPRVDTLRRDERFVQILRKIGLQ